MSLHHYFLFVCMPCVYHTHRHCESLWCYSTRHTHAISSNGQSEREKNYSKKPVRTNKNQHQLYGSTQADGRNIFGISMLLLRPFFCSLFIYSISLKFLLSLSLEALEHNSHLQMDCFHLKSKRKDENKKWIMLRKSRIPSLLSKTVSILRVFLTSLGTVHHIKHPFATFN